MPFRDFQKHCTECKKGEPCGKHHLYVMKLDPSILEKRKFRKANPNYVDGQPLYYVGMTKHHPRCRQSQHQNYSKEGNTKWTCYCQLRPGRHAYKWLGERPSSVVWGHTKGHLRAKPLAPWPDKESAEEAERELAEQLRQDGCGVWAGHHDAKKTDAKGRSRAHT